jgi:hypothetical protein
MFLSFFGVNSQTPGLPPFCSKDAIHFRIVATGTVAYYDLICELLISKQACATAHMFLSCVSAMAGHNRFLSDPSGP